MKQSPQTTTKSVLLMIDYSLSYMGGAQIAFMRQVQAFLVSGWRVTVVAPEAKSALSEYGSPLLTIIEPKIRMKVPALDFPILRNLKSLEIRLLSLAEQGGIDAIIVHSEFALAAMAIRIRNASGIPVLQTVHTFFWQAPRSLGFFAPAIHLFHTKLTGLPKSPRVKNGSKINDALRSMTFRVANSVDLVLSPSNHQAVALRSSGLKNVVTLSNVAEDVTADPPEFNEPLTLLWAARFAPEKRLETALESIRMLSGRVGSGRVVLHVAGGELPSEAGVVSHGRVSPREVSELILKSHAVLSTSHGFDNQPMIALEGFSKSRPFITVDPLLKEEFGDASIVSGSPDPEALSDTLLELLQAPDKLMVASESAKQYALARNSREHVGNILELLETLKPTRS